MVTDLESELESVFEGPERAGGGLGDALAEKLAQRLGGSAKAGAVFGEPVERDGVTIIPVAKIKYGFGAGGGSGSDQDGDHSRFGSGGGGGLGATPIGYIEIREGQARFVTIPGPISEIWPLVVAGGLASWFLLRGIRAIFR